MKYLLLAMLFGAALSCAGGLPVATGTARADTRCLYGPCGADGRLFGSPRAAMSAPRGYRSWNDIYEERNRQRYRSGIEAKPFDFGSSTRQGKPLAGQPKDVFNDDHPEARSEHVRWCLKRYRSYSVTSNTYVTYRGRTRFCDSPFN